MSQLANITRTKAILDKYQFHFQKKFGQNFLVDQNILDKIVEEGEVCENDLVIEVGTGIGTLTYALAQKAGYVVAIEIDTNLIPILEDTLKGLNNIKIIQGDILKTDIGEVINTYGKDRRIKVVANLPYYITTPVIMNFLEGGYPIDSITVMIQSEVASRIQAKAGSKEYGALSLGVQFYGTARVAMKVSKECFIPKPNVDSSVLHFKAYETSPYEVEDKVWLFKLIRAAFNQRRKTLVNALGNSLGDKLSKEVIEKALIELGLDPRVRGEALSLEMFVTLSNKTAGYVK